MIYALFNQRTSGWVCLILRASIFCVVLKKKRKDSHLFFLGGGLKKSRSRVTNSFKPLVSSRSPKRKTQRGVPLWELPSSRLYCPLPRIGVRHLNYRFGSNWLLPVTNAQTERPCPQDAVIQNWHDASLMQKIVDAGCLTA